MMLAWLYSHLIDPLLEDTRLLIPGFAGMTAGKRVLDVCCGTGVQVRVYSAAGLKAVGIDISSSMISRAVKSREGILPAGCFLRADSARLPFPDGSFDFVSVSFGLHDKPEPLRSQTVSEMKRVVKMGGTLVFVDYRVPLARNHWSVLAGVAEFLIGGSHYLGFRQFVISRGLPGLLAGSGITVTDRLLQAGGLMEVVTGTVAPLSVS